MRKTVAIVANSTWNIFNFRLSLIRRLRAEGYEVLVIAPVDEYIHYLNDQYCTRHIPLRRLAPQRQNPLWDLMLLWELTGIYRRERPDVVLHYTIKPNIWGNLAARLAGIPSVSTITGLGYSFLHDGWANRLAPLLYRLALRWSRRIVFFNAADRRLFVERRLVAPARTTIVPGSGVNTNHFRPLPQPDNDEFVFLFIGRLLYDKGLREYVAAARALRMRCPRVSCWVIGELNPDNPAAVAREEMLRWVEARDVRYFGKARDVRPYIKRAHAVVLPSYREGLSRALLEAMAMGKPVIATDVPGCREAVAPGRNGFLVPAHDAGALTDAMEYLCRLDPDSLAAMGQASREHALEHFSEKLITERYLDMIQAILHDGAPASRPVGAPVL